MLEFLSRKKSQPQRREDAKGTIVDFLASLRLSGNFNNI